MAVFKELSKHKFIIILILFLLLFQAACNILLPVCLSLTMDIGIKQNGILYITPNALSKNSFNLLYDTLDNNGKDLILQSYDEQDSSYVLNQYGSDNILKLDSYIMPFATYMGEHIKTDDQLKNMLLSYDRNKYQKSDIEDLREKISVFAKEFTYDSIYEKSIKYVEDEYDRLNIDKKQFSIDFICTIALIMVIILFVYIIVSTLSVVLSSFFSFTLCRDLRSKLMKKIIDFNYIDKNKFLNSTLITRLVYDVNNIQTFIMQFINTYPLSLFIIIANILLIVLICPNLLWIVLLFIVIAVIVCIIIFSGILNIFSKIQIYIDKLSMRISETIKGIMTIRLFNNEKNQERQFENYNKRLYHYNFKSRLIINATKPIISLGLGVVTVLLVWYGGIEVDNYNLTIGMLIVFISCSVQTLTQFILILANIMYIPKGIVSATRIKSVLEYNVMSLSKLYSSTKKIQKLLQTKNLSKTNINNIKDNNNLKIAFYNVCYKYPECDTYVLKDTSFNVKEHTINAFVGETGCGKSTIFKLIIGFLYATNGDIFINKKNILCIDGNKLRSIVGYCPQNSFVFSGTVKSNIAYGYNVSEKDDHKKENELIRQAAENGCLKEFLPDLEKNVAQEGINLSGGQKQRINYARAFMHDYDILIMDDFCSAVDINTEKKLLKTIKSLNNTVLISTNRLSLLKHVDNIFFIDNGCIVNSGTHKYLVDNCNKYKALFINQL